MNKAENESINMNNFHPNQIKKINDLIQEVHKFSQDIEIDDAAENNENFDQYNNENSKLFHEVTNLTQEMKNDRFYENHENNNQEKVIKLTENPEQTDQMRSISQKTFLKFKNKSDNFFKIFKRETIHYLDKVDYTFDSLDIKNIIYHEAKIPEITPFFQKTNELKEKLSFDALLALLHDGNNTFETDKYDNMIHKQLSSAQSPFSNFSPYSHDIPDDCWSPLSFDKSQNSKRKNFLIPIDNELLIPVTPRQKNHKKFKKNSPFKIVNISFVPDDSIYTEMNTPINFNSAENFRSNDYVSVKKNKSFRIRMIKKNISPQGKIIKKQSSSYNMIESPLCERPQIIDKIPSLNFLNTSKNNINDKENFTKVLSKNVISTKDQVKFRLELPKIDIGELCEYVGNVHKDKKYVKKNIKRSTPTKILKDGFHLDSLKKIIHENLNSGKTHHKNLTFLKRKNIKLPNIHSNSGKYMQLLIEPMSKIDYSPKGITKK